MLSPLSQSLEVIVDRAVQFVLQTTRARLEVARSARLYITTKLDYALDDVPSYEMSTLAYLLLAAVIACPLDAWLVLSLRHTRGRILQQPILAAVVDGIVADLAPLPLAGGAISSDGALT